MRKLGFKNVRLFGLLVLLVVVLILIFGYFIRYANNINNREYKVSKDSTIIDSNYNYVQLETDATLKMAYDNNYYINTMTDGLLKKYKIGKNVVLYNEQDHRMYIYGTAYLIKEDGSVKKTTDIEEIIKAASPFFYKLADRKYLFIDKNIFSNDKSIVTKDYLIVELDKQGNATLANHEINIKTINSLILKGSKYDFDVKHEKLIIGDKEINLKNVIGSSNQYKDPEKPNNQEASSGEETNKDTDNNYYDQYFKDVVTSFNNLYNSVNNVNDANKDTQKKEDVYLDLTRWISLTSVTSTVNSITLNYNVFDPNNEYSLIYATVKKTNSDKDAVKYNISKEQNKYTIRGLDYDSEYIITFNYVLANVIDETQSEILSDSVKIKTKAPEIQFKISKITTTKIYYYIKFDPNYKIDHGIINLYADGSKVANSDYDNNMISNNNDYTGFIEYSNLGYIIELKFEDLSFNGELINLSYSSKFINE